MWLHCSTCFGWYLHPSSGAHVTVITASGTVQTVLATFRYRGAVGMISDCSMIVAGSKYSSTSARCCNYSYMCSWWWVEVPPKTCRAVLQKYNKLFYVLLTVHFSNIWFHVPTECTISLLHSSHSSTCFEQHYAHHQEDSLYTYSIWFFVCHSS